MKHLIILVPLWFASYIWLIFFAVQQKPHKLSAEDVRQVMQADIIRLRDQVEADRQLFIKEHENRIIVESQLLKLKAELFKLSR